MLSSSRADAAVTLLAAACGFHLQGRTPLPAPLAVTYVMAEDQQSDFVQGLRKALSPPARRLADASEDASGTVRILTDQVTQKILSVSANNIPREYELTYTVRVLRERRGAGAAARRRKWR